MYKFVVPFQAFCIENALYLILKWMRVGARPSLKVLPNFNCPYGNRGLYSFTIYQQIQVYIIFSYKIYKRVFTVFSSFVRLYFWCEQQLKGNFQTTSSFCFYFELERGGWCGVGFPRGCLFYEITGGRGGVAVSNFPCSLPFDRIGV